MGGCDDKSLQAETVYSHRCASADFMWSCRCGTKGAPAATAIPAPTEAPAPTTEPVTQVPATQAPTSPTAVLLQKQARHPSRDQLAQIDDILKQSISASIAYNKPQSMLLGETTTIELLFNPSLSPEALSTQVAASGVSGEVASASVQITPRMKAH